MTDGTPVDSQRSRARPHTVLLVSATGDWGGAEQVLVLVGRHFVREGWRVLAACPTGGMLAARLSAVGVDVRHFDAVWQNLAHGLGDLPRQLMALRRANRQIRDIILAEDVDTVHGNAIQGHWNAFLGARQAKRPIVFHSHDILPDTLINRWWTRFGMWHCQAAIAVSQAVAVGLRRGGVPAAKIHVIHPPYNADSLDERAAEPCPAAEALEAQGLPVVGFAGALSARKAPQDLIRAAAKILSGGTKARFVFVGGPWRGDEAYAEAAHALPEQLGIGEYVQFTGFQPNPAPWMKRFDVFVIASRQDPCPLVVFEAMHFGKPVVGSDAGGIPEQVVDGETGLIFPTGNADALADRAEKTAADTTLTAEEKDARIREIFGLH